MTKVSIIIPCYNSERFLSTCLNSVLNQTLQEIEVICINDNSEDQTLTILERFKSMYPHKLKIINNPINLGPSASRNKGLKVANGEYIGFVDSDDIITITMFENLYHIIKEHQSSIAITALDRINQYEYNKNDLIYQTKPSKAYQINFEQMPGAIFKETPACWDKLFKHSFLENYQFLEGSFYEDISFVYPLLLKAKTVIELYQIDYFYRQTPNSIMESRSRVNNRILDIFKVYKNSMENAQQLELGSKEITLLKRLMQQEFFLKLEEIERWNISDKDKKYILEKFLQLQNYYLGNSYCNGNLTKIKSMHLGIDSEISAAFEERLILKRINRIKGEENK